MRVDTLVFLLKENEICLALKKRGWGEGNWNGFGGKVEEGESVIACAVRETSEESGVVVREQDLEEVAQIDFCLKDGKHIHVHAYVAKTWEGEPTETEEMKPRWYTFDAVPYDLMWADDIHWLPRVIRGEKLRGVVYFNLDGVTIKDMKWSLA